MALSLALLHSGTLMEPPDSPIPVEQGLVRRARSGDRHAFRVIFERHAPAVRRFLGDLLRDQAAADEGTQETFVRAHRNLGSLKQEDRLLPWLFGIGRFVAMEQLRARKRLTLIDEAQEAGPASIDPAFGPEALLLKKEADTLLERAVGMLDEERRAALLMRIDHGLGYDEIAQAMGWNEAKVKNEIHRARMQLRARLQDYVGGES